MGALFVGAFFVYAISWSLLAYAPYRIGGVYRIGSWQQAYWKFTESPALVGATAVSSLSMLGFAIAYFAGKPHGLLKIALVVISMVLIAMFALPAVN